MGLRTHVDGDGREWNVWDVPPRFSPKRSGKDRRSAAAAPPRGRERRTLLQRRVTVPPEEWVHGWVCFETGEEKRRLCPLPEGWENATPEALEEYLQQAILVHHK